MVAVRAVGSFVHMVRVLANETLLAVGHTVLLRHYFVLAHRSLTHCSVRADSSQILIRSQFHGLVQVLVMPLASCLAFLVSLDGV